MATMEQRPIDNCEPVLEMENFYVYGSERLGKEKSGIQWQNLENGWKDSTFVRMMEEKSYELSNHLGNVHLTLSDYRRKEADGQEVIYYSQINSASDHGPVFGQLLTDGNYSSGDYRFGFNGMEKDDEWSGAGNHYTTLFRQYAPRLGRWLSVDPKAAKMPWESPYISMGDNPISRTDMLGDEWDESNDSKEQADNYREKANEKINDYNEKISSLKKSRSSYKEGSDEYKNISKQIKNLSNKINEINTSLEEVNKLEESDQVYRLEDKYKANPSTIRYSSSGQAEGETKYEDGKVVVQYWREGGGVQYSTMAHELKHAYQYEVGKLSFNLRSHHGYLYDLTDEQGAWQRGSAFNPNEKKPLLEVTREELVKSYGYSEDLPEADLNKNTRYSVIYQAHKDKKYKGKDGSKKYKKIYFPNEQSR